MTNETGTMAGKAQACIMHGEKIATLETRVENNADDIKSLKNLYKEIHLQNINISKMNENISTLCGKVGAIDERVRIIELKPGGRWEKFLWLAGGAGVSGLVVHILNDVGII